MYDNINYHAKRLRVSSKDAANARIRKGRECEHNLSVQDVRDILQGATHCAITGMPIDYATRRRRDPFAPSLDRIDDSRGYTLDNIQVTTFIANTMRNSFDDADVDKFLDFLSKRG